MWLFLLVPLCVQIIYFKLKELESKDQYSQQKHGGKVVSEMSIPTARNLAYSSLSNVIGNEMPTALTIIIIRMTEIRSKLTSDSRTTDVRLHLFILHKQHFLY